MNESLNHIWKYFCCQRQGDEAAKNAYKSEHNRENAKAIAKITTRVYTSDDYENEEQEKASRSSDGIISIKL